MKVKTYIELNALKGLIREKGTSYRKIAIITGLAVPTFSNKINGYSCFDAIEIDKICDYLNINENDVVKYFFPQLLRNSTKNSIKEGEANGNQAGINQRGRKDF